MRTKYVNYIHTYITTIIKERNGDIPRHICFIFHKNECMSIGECSSNRTFIYGNHSISLHAEMDCINQLGLQYERKYVHTVMRRCGLNATEYYNNYPTDTKPISKNFEKYRVYIVRVNKINNNDNNEYKLIDSKPCLHCATLLTFLGFKKVYYSNNDATFTKLNLLEDTYRQSSGYYGSRVKEKKIVDSIAWKK